MSTDSTAVRSGGTGIFGLLLVIFICAKIFGVEPVAHWSWWLVLWPLWAGLGFTALVVFIAIVWAIVAAMRKDG